MMKTKYFGYNRNGGSDKYSEFTETKYLKAKEEEKRWFISFGDNVLECEERTYFFDIRFSYLQNTSKFCRFKPSYLLGFVESSILNSCFSDFARRATLHHNLLI